MGKKKKDYAREETEQQSNVHTEQRWKDCDINTLIQVTGNAEVQNNKDQNWNV